MLSTEQQELRKGKIGSSVIAGVCGLDPWLSPFKLFMQMTGQLDRDEPNRRMLVGHALEPIIPTLFQIDHPEIAIAPCGETWSRPEWPHFCGTPDFLAMEGEHIGVLETKSSTHWAKGDWANGRVPERHIMQAQWQLSFKDTIDFAWVCGFLGNGDDETPSARFEKDVALIEMMQEQASNFMERIRTGTPPPPTSRDTDLIHKYLDKRFKNIEGKIIDLPKETYGAQLARYAELNKMKSSLNKELKAVNTEQDEIENKMALALGDAEAGECGYFLVRWDTMKRKGYTVEPIEKRVLKIRDVK